MEKSFSSPNPIALAFAAVIFGGIVIFFGKVN